ncbi:MAG: LysM peptidoglycan-binding domain-containing protein, partial [Bacilli bacterium]
GGEGAEVVYALRDTNKLAKTVLEEIGKEGQLMRKYYQRRLPTNPPKDYYFIQRETGKVRPLLIEYGFIDDVKDQKKLDDNILKYAEAVVRAVAMAYEVPYTNPIGTPTNVYVVQKGDSLYSIAIKYNVALNELKAANNLTSNILQVGQSLKIPKTTPTPPTNKEYFVYTVKSGDNLYNIASKNNVRVDDIIRLNQLANTNLYINQQLLIPIINQPDNENYYIVKSGDSLYSIALKLDTTVDELIKTNNLANTILKINQKLLIPGKTPSIPKPPLTGEIEYIVAKGDSLYSIAKKYNITADELKNYNKLNTSLLRIGQKLLIPKTENYITYYVKLNDNLYDLAIKYNTTVDEIKKLNNLQSNLLNIDQLLI